MKPLLEIEYCDAKFVLINTQKTIYIEVNEKLPLFEE